MLTIKVFTLGGLKMKSEGYKEEGVASGPGHDTPLISSHLETPDGN
jgi:hypothetical protein